MDKIKVIVTGAAGMLGTAVIDILRNYFHVIATDLYKGYSPDDVRWHEGDLLDSKSLRGWLKKEKPDAVVHCAAIVDVDACEKNPSLAEALHVTTTRNIADVLSGWKGKLIYISTDSVFDGLKMDSYLETDLVNPPNIYAKTKYNGELETQKTERGLVLRTNIFGWNKVEKLSFAEWILKSLAVHEPIRMFMDVMYSPIHVSHLSDIIVQVINNDVCGLYHAGGGTSLSKHAFALQMADIFGLDKQPIIAGSIDDAGLEATRPKNMALSCEKIQQEMDIKLPDVNAGICLMKKQYDSGWLAAIKGRKVSGQYRFWELANDRDNH
jgi:dTDP-4-dehydrorhamnose reductase